jgi:GntR family transcriptional regulator
MEDSLVQAPEDVAAKLGVQTGSMLRQLVRLDYEGGTPLATDEVYMPPSLANCITREMAASPVFMHLWQEETGVELVQTQYEISVTPPTARDIQFLQIGSDIPILVTGELVFDSENNPAMFIVSRYRGDRCKLSKTVTLVQRKTSKGVVGE